MERFFHSLKVEQVNDCRYRIRKEAKADVFECIETYYNAVRRHSTLSNNPPAQPGAFECEPLKAAKRGR